MRAIPRTRISTKKSRHTFLLEAVLSLQKEVGKLRREIQSMIEAEVCKSLGDKIAMIDGSLTETILQKEILIEKGYMTRDEINSKYEELKAKANG